MEKARLKFTSKPLEGKKRDRLNAFRLLFSNTTINYYEDLTFSLIDIPEQMIKLGYKDEQNTVSVTDLYIMFKCEPCVMSQKLIKLKLLKLVDYKKEGKAHLFWVNIDRLNELKKMFNNITNS